MPKPSIDGVPVSAAKATSAEDPTASGVKVPPQFGIECLRAGEQGVSRGDMRPRRKVSRHGGAYLNVRNERVGRELL
jgi:hypothetical protein